MTAAPPIQGARAPRALIVDDNEINADLIEFLLAAAGFEIAKAVDAHQALAQLAPFGPDVILMDLQMPGIDGLELTRMLRADPATQSVAIVAVTASAMKGDEARALAAGCNGYLSKPIDIASFARRVRAFLVAPSTSD